MDEKLYERASNIREQIDKPDVSSILDESGVRKIKWVLERMTIQKLRKESFLFRNLNTIRNVCSALFLISIFANMKRACEKADNPLHPT